jgi:hypothetical protein
MAKKSTKKVITEEMINEQIELIENSTDKIDVSDISTTVDDVKKSLDNVDLTIESNVEENIAKIVKEMDKALEPIKTISAEIDALGQENEVLNKKLATSSPEEIKEYITEEIKKTEQLIEKVEKIKNNTNTRTGFASVTNWWNGMGYDF